jgi:eukaryotic-like serine/threonine-protein kinase
MSSIQPLYCPKCSTYFPHGEIACAKDGAALQPLKLDGYVLEEKIGAGGMGEVWKARHSEIGKRAAIKVLGRDIAQNEKATRRFLQEARSVNEVSHRNLVDIFAFGQTSDGQPYMIMELLHGKPLSSYLKQKGVLSLSEIIALIGPVCSALHKTHEAGLIHRDLKPDNLFVMLQDDAEPLLKILDFGLVKFAQEEEDAGGMTHSTAIFGTPEYMSPEQCQKSRDVDRRTDIYALGVILSSMLTGRTPFREREDSATMVMVKQITLAPIPPSSLVSGRTIPSEIDAVVLQALAKDRELRYPTTLALLEDLKKAAAPYLYKPENLSTTKPIYFETSTVPMMQMLPSATMSLDGTIMKSGYYTGAVSKKINHQEKPKLVGLFVAAGIALVGVGSFGGYLLSIPSQERSTKEPPGLNKPATPTVASTPNAIPEAKTQAPLPNSTPSSTPITPTKPNTTLTTKPPEKTTPSLPKLPTPEKEISTIEKTTTTLKKPTPDIKKTPPPTPPPDFN